MREVQIVGMDVTPFGPYGVGTGVGLAATVSRAALAQAGLTFDRVDLVIGATAHPLSARPILVTKELGLTGVPVQQVSNASATGLAGLHEGFEAIRRGRAEVVLVVAYDAPEVDLPVEKVIADEGHFPPVVSYALMARERMNSRGTTPEHLALVAAKNWNYARTNPIAARRSETEVGVDDILGSRMIADPLTARMVTPWCEGAGAVVLAAEGVVERPLARVRASVFTTTVYQPDQILEGPIGGPPEVGIRAADLVLQQAGVDRGTIDVVQIHDAFAIEELEYYETLGFAERADVEGLVEAGAFGPGSRQRFGLPEFSTGGGLLARGHPGATTGIAQIAETIHRFSSTDDRVGLCHLLGAGGLCVAQVISRD